MTRLCILSTIKQNQIRLNRECFSFRWVSFYLSHKLHPKINYAIKHVLFYDNYFHGNKFYLFLKLTLAFPLFRFAPLRYYHGWLIKKIIICLIVCCQSLLQTEVPFFIFCAAILIVSHHLNSLLTGDKYALRLKFIFNQGPCSLHRIFNRNSIRS